jgi:hypothetical protein
MKTNERYIKKIGIKCVNAIEDIRSKIKTNTGIELDFIQGSELLGEKYSRGQLETISFDEIRNRFGNRRRGRQWKNDLKVV